MVIDLTPTKTRNISLHLIGQGVLVVFHSLLYVHLFYTRIVPCAGSFSYFVDSVRIIIQFLVG